MALSLATVGATVVGGAGVLVAAMLFALSARDRLAVRRIDHAATTDPDGIEPGPVAISGTTTATNGTLSGPVTGEDSVAYRYAVREREDGDWSVAHVGHETVAFGVERGGTTVAVDPDGADVRLPRRAATEVGVEQAPPAALRSFLEASPTVEATMNDRRYVEAALRPGDGVYVRGEAVEDGDGIVVRPGADGVGVVIADPADHRYQLRRRARLFAGGGVLVLLGVAAVVALGAGLF